MPDILTALTSFAVSVFRERSKPNYIDEIADRYIPFWSSDVLLQEAHRKSLILPTRHPEIEQLITVVFSEPELRELAPTEGQLPPMILTPNGGMRITPTSIITGLLASALLQMYFLRLPDDEGTFVRTVLEGFEELRRALRGERIRAHLITGVAGMALPDNRQLSTPWGVIRPAPIATTGHVFQPLGQARSTCVLAEPRLIPVIFDRAPSPQNPFDASESDMNRPRVLLPLACAIATSDYDKPVAPLLTWSTSLFPFQSAFSYSMALAGPAFATDVNLEGRINDVEEWARVVERVHTPTIDIAARRLISAIAMRSDRSDALVDAVMVWENLLGTRSETTFRVTAALAKLLESEPAKRRMLRKELARIYDTRSRVVHGDAGVAPDVDKNCSEAIQFAARALRAAYLKGRDWLTLSSNERADTILLEWQ